ALLAVREEDVGRLDVAVDDPARLRVRETLEHLRPGLDGVAVTQLTGPERVAKRPPGCVLVRHVDVPRVASARVGAEAALVPQPRRDLCFALGPLAGLPVTRDDLQGDVEAGSLVAGEPDGARAAAPERPQRPVAVED